MPSKKSIIPFKQHKWKAKFMQKMTSVAKEFIANGGDFKKAMVRAGYNKKSLAVNVSRFKNNPVFVSMVLRELETLPLSGQLMDSFLVKFLLDTGVQVKDRISCINIGNKVLKRYEGNEEDKLESPFEVWLKAKLPKGSAIAVRLGEGHETKELESLGTLDTDRGDGQGDEAVSGQPCVPRVSVLQPGENSHTEEPYGDR